MAIHGVIAVGAMYGTVAAEATNAAGGSDYVELGVGSTVAIIVALIGLYGNRRRRDGTSDEEIHALDEAFVGETKSRLTALEMRTGAIEDHLRPWRKE